MSGVDAARCFTHAPVTAFGLSHATKGAVTEAWRAVASMGRALHMAGGGRLLAV